MASVDQYANYSAVELATDAAFIAWVKCPGTDSDLFWNEYLSRYPLQAGSIQKARAIVLQMRAVQETMDENRAVAVWNKISRRIVKRPAERKQQKVVSLSYWTAAAAVVLLMVLGIWFYSRENSGVPNQVSATAKTQDIPPGGDKAILTLADGSRVVLDSAVNGALTRQGSVTVIKLNGQLAYRAEGSMATEVLYNTISTPKGGQYQLVLADGSKVWLNAASSLRFPTAFTGKERRVELTGEGYFEVAHDETKPFHVSVHNMDVEVLGTHFNINAYNDEPSIKTTLLQGRVKVKKDEKLVYLNPGQQATVKLAGNTIKIDYDVDTEEVVAWKNGRFQFNSANIETIMRQAARWYDADVQYQGEISETFSGGLPRSENISQLLKILEATGKVDFSINGKRIIVQPK